VKLTLDQIARARVREWLTATGTTQTALGERIGRTQAWMSRYLLGEFDADLTTLQKIAEVFGHSIAALLDAPSDPAEATLLNHFRAVDAEKRVLALRLLESWVHPPTLPRRRRGGSSSPSRE
jgi:transcriptional regulator with XRE-family HTH domain